MGTLRAIIRILLTTFWTTFLYIPVLLITLIPLGSTRVRFKARSMIMQLWAKGLLRILGIHVRLSGAVPKPPFLFVSNHLGYADIFVFVAYFPAWFISKSDVKSWPVFGALVKKANVLFIDRNLRRDVTRIGSLMTTCLDEGNGVVFFPEGTSTRGETVLPFKPSLFQAAAREQRPVYYGAIRYEIPENTPPAHLAVCWWGDMDFAPHLYNMMKIKKIYADLTLAKEPVIEGERKVLARVLQNRVESLFVPVR